MLIEIHAIQNHSPSNLNRDDLGSPKTCCFGGVLRSRISSQCIKRSIRMSYEFHKLLGGVRTRRLAKLIAEKTNSPDMEKRMEAILQKCGFLPKSNKKKKSDDDNNDAESGDSKMLVYTTREAIDEMAKLLQNNSSADVDDLTDQFSELIAKRTAVPDMALSGRMLEPSADIWKHKNTTVEAALQVAHAISTHEARPEIDYYVAADDIPGDDAGAGFVGETMFASACFYKYFSIHWETLVANLKGNKEMAAHAVGAFIRGAALTNPTGKQNSFAAHNPPDGMVIEIKNTPISYANAFARPVVKSPRDMISQSIAQLGQYIHDLDTGYGRPQKRFWFSPNLRYTLSAIEDGHEIAIAENNHKSLDELVPAAIAAIGYDWKAVQGVIVS